MITSGTDSQISQNSIEPPINEREQHPQALYKRFCSENKDLIATQKTYEGLFFFLSLITAVFAIGLGISYAILQNPDNKIWFSFISIPFSACVVSGYQSWRYNNKVLQKEDEFMILNARQTMTQDSILPSLMALGLQPNWQETGGLGIQNQSSNEQEFRELGMQNKHIIEGANATQVSTTLRPGLATKMEPESEFAGPGI